MPSVQTYAPILQIVQNTCRLLSINVPNAVYASQDENSVLLGAQANFLGPMLMGDHKWQQFRDNFDITGDGVQTVFPIPDDYWSLVNDTGWSLSNRMPCYLVNAQQWAGIAAFIGAFTLRPVFRLLNNNFEFLSPPALGETIRFEYAVRNWVQDATNAALQKEALTNDSDTPLFDSLLFTLGLKIKWRETKGFDTNADARDFNARQTQILDKDQPGQILSLTGSSGVPYISGANLPITGYGV